MGRVPLSYRSALCSVTIPTRFQSGAKDSDNYTYMCCLTTDNQTSQMYLSTYLAASQVLSKPEAGNWPPTSKQRAIYTTKMNRSLLA